MLVAIAVGILIIMLDGGSGGRVDFLEALYFAVVSGRPGIGSDVVRCAARYTLCPLHARCCCFSNLFPTLFIPLIPHPTTHNPSLITSTPPTSAHA